MLILLLVFQIWVFIEDTGADNSSQNNWSLEINIGLNDTPRDLIQLKDGNYFVLTDSNNGGHKETWLLKIDDSGNLIWDKNISTPMVTGTQKIIEVTDGFIIGGTLLSPSTSVSNFWLLKTDKNGIKQWNYTYGVLNYSVSLKSFIKTDDDGFLLLGYTNIASTILIKVDSNGIPEWNKTINAFQFQVPTDIIESQDNGFIFGGFIQNTTDYQSNFWLGKVDSYGRLEWNKTVVSDGNGIVSSLTTTADGKILALGSVYNQDNSKLLLVELDPNGSTLWSNTFENGYNIDANTILKNTNEGYVIVVTINQRNTSISNIGIINLNSSGDQIGNSTYESHRNEKSVDSIVNDNGNLLILGETFEENTSNLIVLKTNENGFTFSEDSNHNIIHVITNLKTQTQRYKISLNPMNFLFTLIMISIFRKIRHVNKYNT